MVPPPRVPPPFLVARHAPRPLQLCCAALRALKPGGRLVYSTCSIVPAENGGVVQKLLQVWDEGLHGKLNCGGAGVACAAGRVQWDALEKLRFLHTVCVRCTSDPRGSATSNCAPLTVPHGPHLAALQRFPDNVRLLPAAELLEAFVGAQARRRLGLEAVDGGAICLPDRAGWGPIYVAALTKVGSLVGPAQAAQTASVVAGLDEGSDSGSGDESNDGGAGDAEDGSAAAAAAGGA